jgi:hypothetical protein
VLPERAGEVRVIRETEIGGKPREVIFAADKAVKRGADPQLRPVAGNTPAGGGGERAAEMVRGDRQFGRELVQRERRVVGERPSRIPHKAPGISTDPPNMWLPRWVADA